MLISSLRPLKVYYHDGFLRVSLFKYADQHKHKGAAITNTELSKKIIKDCEKSGRTHYGMNASELRDFQMKTLDQLGEHLYKTGRTDDPHWADNYLRPQFKRAFMSVAKMIQKRLPDNPEFFEMFGVDFVITNNL